MLVIVLAYIKVRDMSAGRQTEHSKMELSILTTLGGGGGGVVELQRKFKETLVRHLIICNGSAMERINLIDCLSNKSISTVACEYEPLDKLTAR